MNDTSSNSNTHSDAKDTASVSSHHTGTTQTRFSFYNAQDFVQQTPPPELSPTKKESHSHHHHHPVNRDSVEILRSLQEHEQQRLEILGANGGVAARQERHMTSSADAIATGMSEAFRIDLSMGPSSSDVSNPYEDAIKEALDLLRKHRSPREPFVPMSQASTPAVSNVMHLSSPTRTPGGVQHSRHWMENHDLRSRTPPDEDRILQLREEVSNDSNKQDGDTEDDEFDLDGDGGARAMPDQGAVTASAVALGEAYQAEIEARRKQRQERMAKYATRLAELKQEDKYTPLTADHHHGYKNHHNNNAKANHGSSNSDVGQNWGGPRLDAMTSWQQPTEAVLTSRSVPSTFPNLPTSRAQPLSSSAGAFASSSLTIPAQIASMNKEEEVQRGVERVLLAILERANSQGRGSRRESISTPSATNSASNSPWQTSTNREEKKAASPEDSRPTVDFDAADNALVRAMTDLLGAPSTSTLGSSSPNNNAMRQSAANNSEEMLHDFETELESFDQSQAAPSVTADQASFSSSHRKTNLTIDTSLGTDPRTTVTVQRDDSPEDDLDKIVRTVHIQDAADARPRKDDVIDRRVRSVLSPDPDKQRDADDEIGDNRKNNYRSRVEHVRNHEVDEDGDNDPIDESFDDVNDDDDENVDDEEAFDDDEEAFDDLDDDDDENNNNHSELDGVLGPLSKTSGGTTGVVLQSSSSDQRDSFASPSLLDSLSAAVSMVTGALTDETNDKYAMNDVDDETEELMKTLCAHLFEAKTSMAQSAKLIDKRPDWDETNPDEAGYRIIRLTTVQLAAVEFAFERMIDNVKRKEEREKRDNDDAFERDLKEAEDLLDEQERKSKRSNEKDKHNLDAEMAVRARIYPQEQPLPCFPGVKSTGRGEMGDLEYFQLPIIYKSHVTGFEPTKDLVLEAGNVVAGQYLVEGELGSAAFSTAYRCVDLNSDGDGPDGHDEVCLKVIKNTKDFFDQSLDEIKILELLRQTGMCHEMNIVEMKTFFYHREHLIIVTELLRQNLFEFGKFIVDSNEEPYFTMPRLCYLTRQILVALDFVHKLGLVHSDVKPENILLSSYSRAQVKVIDFGSSCFLTDRQSSYIQSRSYRAPEVILGLPYDGRIDVWSLACVVAEMYTGEVTFQNDSIVSMLSRIEAICGTFPSHMIAQGRQSGRFFTKCGLLFEKLPVEEQDDSHSDDESDDEDSSGKRKRYVDVFQPKVTSIAARLGFSPSLMKKYRSNAKITKEEKLQAMFVDFIQKLLTIDPDKRPTAAEALELPWMKYAENLTEEDIKYPSS
ncbi:hypothetical protein ACA910_016668 [Epithemia clementina (nom. ined.)]